MASLTESRRCSSGFRTRHESPPTNATGQWEGTRVQAPPPRPPPPGSTACSCPRPPTSTAWRPFCGTATSCRWTTTCRCCWTGSSSSESTAVGMSCFSFGNDQVNNFRLEMDPWHCLACAPFQVRKCDTNFLRLCIVLTPSTSSVMLRLD